MKKILLVAILLMQMLPNLLAQTDSTGNSLLNDLNSDVTEQKLLPDRMIITQRILWGEKGVMRSMNTFELTPEKRAKELQIRRYALATHQALGFATLAGMIAQGVVGSQLYNGKTSMLGAHEALAAGVNIGYFTTAGLALFAPPKMVDERKGYSSIKLHKALAVIHLTSMIATNVLAGQVKGNPDLKPYHRAAAYTAFGSFALAMVVIKF